jgi:hypothetical protein
MSDREASRIEIIDQLNLDKFDAIDLNGLDNRARQARVLFDFIDSMRGSILAWSENLPEMSGLSSEDQLKMFQASFFEILVLELVWRSIENHSSKVNFNSEINFSDRDLAKLNMNSFVEQTNKMRAKLEGMKLTRDELWCLKTLILFKSDFGFTNTQHVENCREKCLVQLRDLSSNSFRHDTLILMLSDLKVMSVILANALLVLYGQSRVDCPNLLRNLLIHYKY